MPNSSVRRWKAAHRADFVAETADLVPVRTRSANCIAAIQIAKTIDPRVVGPVCGARERLRDVSAAPMRSPALAVAPLARANWGRDEAE